MTIQMVLHVKPEQLKTYKSILIKPVLKKGDGACGEVTKIMNERSDGYFDCEVIIYPAYQERVLKAWQNHNDKLAAK